MNKKTKLTLIRVTALLFSITCVYLLAPWQAALYYLTPLPQSVQQQVDDAIDHDLDGIIVYTQHPEQGEQLYASGWHNKDKAIVADPNALFKIASIGKLYNAAAIAKLVAQKKLSLTETLATYLPQLTNRIEHADNITLAMLVQHRSGIPNYTNHPNFNWGESAIGVDENLELVIDTPADFEPGTDYGYSNTNYLLLQKIMTKVLGYDHHKFIRDEILSPLALQQTFFSVNDVDQKQLMSGYHIDYPNDFKMLQQGYVATAKDVGKFLRALNKGNLFTEQEQHIYSSIYEFEHTGWVLGYYSIARYHRDIDTVVIQFVNTVGGNTVTMTDVIYHRIIQILRKQQNNNSS